MKKYKLLIALSIIISSPLIAQQGDIFKSEAIMYEGQGNYPKAAVIYEKAISAYDNENTVDTMSVFKAGQSYVRAKQYTQAIPFLNRCIELNYPEPAVYLALSGAYAGLKDKENAVKALEDGMTKYPSSKSDFIKKLGYLYFNSGKYDKAISSLKLALDENPDNETFLYLYGSSWDKLNKFEEATDAFEKLLAINPSHKNAITKLGLVYYRFTDYKFKKEKKRYERLKNPSRVDYHDYTEKVTAIYQGYKKALPHLEKAHQLSPSNKTIINCLSISYKRLDMKDRETAMKALLK